VHEKAGNPLSVIVIVPGWCDDACKSFHLMNESIYNRGPTKRYYLILERAKHNYRPGMQHRSQHEEQASNVNTFVFFLQNDLGAAKWPVTKEKIAALQARVAN
jgi:hypothetical protein